MSRSVILCDESGNPTGTEEIVRAHTGDGSLHLAFSAYVFNNDYSKLLIQRRSADKMLWPLIWANTCCSHPFEGEEPIAAGQRRLNEELGFSTPLQALLSFVYRALDPNDAGVEHEFVTVLIGKVNDDIWVDPNPEEVSEWKWITIEDLQEAMRTDPLLYAPWLKLGLEKLLTAEDFPGFA